MKTEEQFNYDNDIEPELVKNHHNLISLFEKKFQSEIQAQNQLIVKCLTDKEFKTNLLEYIKLPEIQQELKQELENNPFITQFLRLSHQNEKDFPSLDKLMLKMCLKLEKKANNHNQPLTFYNEYVELSDKIQSCFLLRKGIKDDMKNQDEVLDGKCGLKMTKYIKHYRFDHYCSYCKNGFKNQSGLRSHENTCKKREKVKEVVVKKRQNSKRCSKKRHQNLDEQKMLKLK